MTRRYYKSSDYWYDLDEDKRELRKEIIRLVNSGKYTVIEIAVRIGYSPRHTYRLINKIREDQEFYGKQKSE